MAIQNNLTGHYGYKSYLYLFRTLNELLEITERSLAEYNSEQLRESLNNLMPEEYDSKA